MAREKAASPANLTPVPGYSADIGARLGEIIRIVGGLAAAAKISGASDDTLANWQSGRSRPNFFGVLALCQAANRSLDWLAAGSDNAGRSQSQSMSLGQPLDVELLRKIVGIVEEALSAQRKTLPPAKKAELIAESYSFCMDEAALSGAEAKDIAPRVLGRFLRLVA